MMGTSLGQKHKGDHLSRFPEARLGSGLGKTPAPACVDAQNAGADTPTLRILEEVQTGSGAHWSMQTEATFRQTLGRSAWPTRAKCALRATRCYRTPAWAPSPRACPRSPPRALFALRHSRERKACTLRCRTCAPRCGPGQRLSLCTQTSDPILGLPNPKAWCDLNSSRAGERWSPGARPAPVRSPGKGLATRQICVGFGCANFLAV